MRQFLRDISYVLLVWPTFILIAVAILLHNSAPDLARLAGFLALPGAAFMVWAYFKHQRS